MPGLAPYSQLASDVQDVKQFQTFPVTPDMQLSWGRMQYTVYRSFTTQVPDGIED
jgi:hypothetical protein